MTYADNGCHMRCDVQISSNEVLACETPSWAAVQPRAERLIIWQKIVAIQQLCSFATVGF